MPWVYGYPTRPDLLLLLELVAAVITQICGARVTPAHSADPTLTHTMRLAKDRKEERASSTEIQEIWIPKTPKPKQERQ